MSASSDITFICGTQNQNMKFEESFDSLCKTIKQMFHLDWNITSLLCDGKEIKDQISYNEYINLLLSPDKNTFFDQVIQSCHNLNMDTNHDTLYDFIHLSKVHVIHDEINPYSYDEPIRIKLSDISAYQFGGYDFLKNRK